MKLFKKKQSGQTEAVSDNKPTETTSGKSSRIMGGSFFSKMKSMVEDDTFLRENIQRQYLYILLLFVLAMVYINNRFLHERELRELNKAKEELVDLKYRSLTITRDLKITGRRTEVRKALKNQGSDVEESTSPVIIIRE